MNRNQIFSIILSFIMIGSIVGTAVYFSNSSGQQQEQPQTQEPTLTKDIKGFKATGVKASVSAKLPALAIQGVSSTTNISDIETELTKTTTFVNFFDSRFVSAGENPVYFALYRISDVSLLEQAETEAREVLQNTLQEVNFFHYASVDLPEPVSFQQENSDNLKNLNIQAMEVFIFDNTQEGTDIELDCSALIDINSDQISSLICSEIETGREQGGFQIINFEAQTTILDLNNTLTFAHKTNYADDFDENTLKQVLESVTGVTEVEYLNYTRPQARLTVMVGLDEANDLEKRGPLESGLTFLAHTEDVTTSMSQQGFSAIINFNKDIDLNALKTEINTLLEDSNITTGQISENELNSELNSYIHFSDDVDITMLLITLEAALSENGVEPTLARIAYGDLPPQLEYSSKKYFVQNPENAGMVVLPTREVGDEIPITLIGIASGDTLTSYALVKDKGISGGN
ncbi:MAG: hypothetical protein GOV15_01695 [Candidatus Diapherotrites archaeon]|nr:hypothetical protein [Candidatus Diapherotrites archaeon]